MISFVSIGDHFHGEEQGIQSATEENQRKAVALSFFYHPRNTRVHRTVLRVGILVSTETDVLSMGSSFYQFTMGLWVSFLVAMIRSSDNSNFWEKV